MIAVVRIRKNGVQVRKLSTKSVAAGVSAAIGITLVGLNIGAANASAARVQAAGSSAAAAAPQPSASTSASEAIAQPGKSQTSEPTPKLGVGQTMPSYPKECPVTGAPAFNSGDTNYYLACLYGINLTQTVASGRFGPPVTLNLYRRVIDNVGSGYYTNRDFPQVWGQNPSNMTCSPDQPESEPWCVALTSTHDESGVGAWALYSPTAPTPFWDMVAIGFNNPYHAGDSAQCGSSFYIKCTLLNDGGPAYADLVAMQIQNLPVTVSVFNNLPSVPPNPVTCPTPTDPATNTCPPGDNVLRLMAPPTTTPSMILDPNSISTEIAPGETGYFTLYQPYSTGCRSLDGDDGGSTSTSLCLPPGDTPALSFAYTLQDGSSGSVQTAVFAFNVLADGKGGVLSTSTNATNPNPPSGGPTSACLKLSAGSGLDNISSCTSGGQDFISKGGSSNAYQTLAYTISEDSSLTSKDKDSQRATAQSKGSR